jgi:hypothetical protein
VQVAEQTQLEKFQSDSDLGAGINSATRSDGDQYGKNSHLQSFSEQGLPEDLRVAVDENPELRTAWQHAQEYRKTSATPEAERQATSLLTDLDSMDALFFSRKPEDHAELARSVAAWIPSHLRRLPRRSAEVANHSQKGAPRETRGPAQGTAQGETGLDRNAPREAETPALQT